MHFPSTIGKGCWPLALKLLREKPVLLARRCKPPLHHPDCSLQVVEMSRCHTNTVEVLGKPFGKNIGFRVSAR